MKVSKMFDPELDANSDEMQLYKLGVEDIETPIVDLYGKKLKTVPSIILNCVDLESLYLSENQITKIENIPEWIVSLSINHNQIQKIENIPNKVWVLDLSDNQITKIENLPDSTKQLYLYNNQITKIENLPDKVSVLFLFNNKITKIENLPDNIGELDLRSNPLKQITKQALEIIMRNDVDVRGVYIDSLEVVDD